MENLKFRRQFLFSAKKCSQLEDWQKEIFDNHILYVHKDCEVTRVDYSGRSIIIIGYAINPKVPEKGNLDIATDISKLSDLKVTTDSSFLNAVTGYLYGLVGRFVLMIIEHGRLRIFNDACGLKTVYYTKFEDEIYAASQPLIMGLVIPVEKSDNHRQYYNSVYVNETLEHFMPSGCSLYKDVCHLTPNHYFDSKKYRQIRFWPDKNLERKELNEAVKEFTSVLRQTMIAAHKRFKLVFQTTAGWDSRIILSACKEIADDMFFYTLKYRKLNEESDDIKIPGRLLSGLGLQHNVINCRKPVNEGFKDAYQSNSDPQHWIDWGLISNGLRNELPQESLPVNGNCPEIVRCDYYSDGKHPDLPSYKVLIKLLVEEAGWQDIEFIRDRMSQWYDEIIDEKMNLGYYPFDLFAWEHSMGSWQAHSQLEREIVHDTFSPFNNRELLDIALSVSPLFRCSPDWIFFRKSIRLSWSEVLQEPVNPKRNKRPLMVSLKCRSKTILLLSDNAIKAHSNRIYQMGASLLSLLWATTEL